MSFMADLKDTESLRACYATRNVVLRQGKKAFYEGNVLLWHLTGIKSLFDAGRGL